MDCIRLRKQCCQCRSCHWILWENSLMLKWYFWHWFWPFVWQYVLYYPIFVFSEPGPPMKCPFQDAYHFTYNNNTGGWCRSPTSYVKSCASDARLIFHLKHCPDAAYTYEIGESPDPLLISSLVISSIQRDLYELRMPTSVNFWI